MTFGTPTQTSETTGNKELKLEKKNLEKEIGALGVQHEKTATVLKEIESRKSKIKDNKALLERLEKKKMELESTLAGLGSKIKKREKKLIELDKQHSAKVAALNLEFSEKSEDLQHKLSDIEKEIDTASKKLDPITSKKEKLEGEKNKVVEEIIELENKVETLKKDIFKLGRLIKELPAKEKQKKELDISITNLQTLETSLGNKLKQLQKEMTTISNRVAKAKAEAEKFIKEKKGIREKFDNEMKKEREVLDKRDGLVSEKEEWVKGKEEDLRRAKAELEKFYNRKIPHVII